MQYSSCLEEKLLRETDKYGNATESWWTLIFNFRVEGELRVGGWVTKEQILLNIVIDMLEWLFILHTFVVVYHSYVVLSHTLSNLSLKLAPLCQFYYICLYNIVQRNKELACCDTEWKGKFLVLLLTMHWSVDFLSLWWHSGNTLTSPILIFFLEKKEGVIQTWGVCDSVTSVNCACFQLLDFIYLSSEVSQEFLGSFSSVWFMGWITCRKMNRHLQQADLSFISHTFSVEFGFST